MLLAAPVGAQTSDRPRLTAAQADAIRVDGLLDDAVWAGAAVATDFVQYEPAEGAPATFRTTVRVALTPNGVAVAAEMQADEPSQIRRSLSRRDERGAADAFAVALDSYDAGQTAFLFGVTAAGVQFDALVEGSGSEDRSWDAVWESAVRIGAGGWTAELLIPASQLRFSAGTPSWGVNFQRVSPATGEESYWAPVTRAESGAGIVRLYGRLDGLAGLRPRPIIQATPYTLARANRFESATQPGAASATYGAEVGADLKVGLSSAVVLDATLNPDFGQVEADPAELNLTTFETFFDERRPFFLEGTQIFDADYSRDGGLLYTRRIGARAPIIGAVKLTGRSSGGFSAGALTAVTGNDLSPEEGFVSVRARQDLGGQDFVGTGASGFTSADARSLAVAGDWGLRVGPNEEFLFEGILTGTAREDRRSGDAQEGFALYTGFDQVKGYRTFGTGFRVFSDGFALNDVGRFTQTDLVRVNGAIIQLWNQGQPFGPVRRLNTFLFGSATWRYSDGTFRGGDGGLNSSGSLRGFQQISFNAGLAGLGGLDIRETRGAGPIANLPVLTLDASLSSDTRRPLVVDAEMELAADSEGGVFFGPRLEADWTASDRLDLSLNAGAGWGTNQRAWVANEAFFLTDADLFVATTTALPGSVPADGVEPLGLGRTAAAALLDGVAPAEGAILVPGATAYRVPLFGQRDTRQADLVARATATVSPTLSLQLYGQVFAARGRYDGFRLLAAPADLRDLAAYPKRRDFAISSFTANAVLRWQYRPGSTVFVVWTQSRGDGLAEEALRPTAPSPFDQGVPDQVRDTFRRFPDNVFLVKVNVLLMR